MNMFKKNGGFTLVELIVVIVILAILAAVAVPAYSGYITKAQDAAIITELDAIATAAQAANAANGKVTAIEVVACADDPATTEVEPEPATGKATTVKITVTADGGANLDGDFATFLSGAKAYVEAEGTTYKADFFYKLDLNGTSYENGVDWAAGKWTAKTAANS